MENQEFKGWMTGEIEQFVAEDPDNRLERLGESPIFEQPLVGFVAGSDPVFLEIKEAIGDFHLTPR